MRARTLLGVAALVAIVTVYPLRATTTPSPTRPYDLTVPGATLPIVRAHRYTMSGKIRPLLFWIGRDDVGLGELAWRRGERGEEGWAFLIGTDPARAPRGLNRWGFIAEQANGADGTLLAVMTRSDEEALGEVEIGSADGAGDFKAIRAQVRHGESRARIAVIRTPEALSIHDLDALVHRVLTMPEEVAVRTVSTRPGSRPGFLAAVAALVAASVESHRRSPAPKARGAVGPLPYVFGDRLYEVGLAQARRLEVFEDGGHRYANVVNGRFEIRNLTTGERTRFELVYGLDGDLSGVPVRIAYQPRWWLKVELHLAG